MTDITFAFQYWSNHIASRLYTGNKAIEFVDMHYAKDNRTCASICYGNNPLIADAYNAMREGGWIWIGLCSDTIHCTTNDGNQFSFPAFI